MALKKNQSGITHVEVSFKEIERLYDTIPGPGGRPAYRIAVMDRSGNPKMLIKDPFKIISRDSDNVSDEDGNPVFEQMSYLLGPYRAVRRSEVPYFVWHTFARWKCQPIGGKYVYVWAADAKDGSGIRLLHELLFSNGDFQFVDRESSDAQTRGGPQSSLVLDMISFKDGQCKQCFYFFLLAPFRIPSKRLDEIQKDVPTRAMRLWDEFYTDIYQGEGHKNPEPADGPPEKLPAKLSYVVYLLDPFREALCRSERYKNALYRWREAQRKMADNDEYKLAKRIEAFSGMDPKLKENLDQTFREYVDEKEAESRRRLWVTVDMANELIRWVGEKEMREPMAGPDGSCDTWRYIKLTPGKPAVISKSKEDKGKDDFHNLYSQACHDYSDAPDEIGSEVAQLMCAVIEGLEQSPTGQGWLGKRLKGGMEGEKPEKEFEFDEWIWECGRKKNEFYKTLVTGLLKPYGPSWYLNYGAQGLEKFSAWLQGKHGVKLHWRTVSESRRRLKRIARLEPLKSTALNLSAKQMEILQLGVEIMNMYNALQKLRHSDDAWDYLEAFGSALDLSVAMRDALNKIQWAGPIEEVAETGSLATRVFKIGALSGMVDVVTGSHDVYKSWNDSTGAIIANSMRTLGGALVVVGEIGEEHPLGWIATCVGVVLQSGGSYLRVEFDPACIFLRHCRWGKGPNIKDSAVSLVKDESDYWYKGKLSALAGDIKAQDRCLDQLLFNYEINIQFEADADSNCRLNLTMNPRPRGVGTDGKWDVQVELKKDYGESAGTSSKRTFTFSANDDFGDENWTAGDTYSIPIFGTNEIPARQYRSVIWFTAKVRAKLNVFGKGGHTVEREEEKTYAYSIPATDIEPRPQPEYGVPGCSDTSGTDAGGPSVPGSRSGGTD